MSQQIAKVLLVDDHALYRDGLREIIERWDDFEVVGEAENGQEAVEFCRLLKPDLVLMDLKMPGMDGIMATTLILEENPRIAVVILSVYEGEDEVISAVKAGARGYVLKNCYARQLHNRLKGVMEGNCTLSEESAKRCMDYIRTHDTSMTNREYGEIPSPESLTAHEKQVLSLLAMGLSNKEIGDRLYISESTVKKQISFLLAKLDLGNRVQAAVFALRSGIAE